MHQNKKQMAEYLLGDKAKQIFTSALHLPTEAELEEELKRELNQSNMIFQKSQKQMINNNLYNISSTQTSIHKNLESVVKKHATSAFLKPIPTREQAIFEALQKHIDNRSLILDAGCGTGRSTHMLAEQHPNHLVIGIDKSAHRLKTSEVDNSVNSSR